MPGPVDRDRDDDGRARNARPRDGLGRPLPYGTRGEERAPEGVVRTAVGTLAEAQALLDAGRPFHAHEVFEDAWKTGPAGQRELWRGLAQLAVGLTHAARGNGAGARTLLDRAAGHLVAAAEVAAGLGLDAGALAGWARSQDPSRPVPAPRLLPQQPRRSGAPRDDQAVPALDPDGL